ncbi:alpha/beta hydrolase fold domain-containing protein [Catenulispora rubra]|uniref:alpha/beta hydrolase fold domain-containing protein n=1 Tax=Catenulispora rubra TaxID=280293 RepID=UPI0018926A05|nr:alpha/beta hydrolase fold domain-containing protein [Catenulispora rubra]
MKARVPLFDVDDGGFTLGDLDTSYAASAALARELGVVIVSVGYRLAPEVPCLAAPACATVLPRLPPAYITA